MSYLDLKKQNFNPLLLCPPSLASAYDLHPKHHAQKFIHNDLLCNGMCFVTGDEKRTGVVTNGKNGKDGKDSTICIIV